MTFDARCTRPYFRGSTPGRRGCRFRRISAAGGTAPRSSCRRRCADCRWTGAERDALRREILDEIFAFGPITPLLADPAISEIMVNGYESIYVERDGLVTRHGGSFLSEESLRATIDRMVSKVNRRLDESSPYVDARLPDGSRINAIIPPVCLTGACLTIRKFRKEAFSLEELVRIGSVARGCRGVPERGRPGAAQRHRLRGNRLREDHPAERPVPVHPRGRADRHDRGCGRDPPSEAPRDPARGETGQHRRSRAPSPSGTSSATPSACAPTGSSSGSAAAGRRSTCCRR